MIRRISVWLVSGAVIVAAILATLIFGSGFPHKYMDLDDSGFITVREAIRTLDMGVREVTASNVRCIEIFGLKDGLPIKLICLDH